MVSGHPLSHLFCDIYLNHGEAKDSGEYTMRVCLSICFLLSFMTCEAKTTVKLEGGEPPVFVLSGSGKLLEVYVWDPMHDEEWAPFDKKHALWVLTAEENGGEWIRNVGVVTYGLVPSGYRQLKPENGELPPPLVSGKRYSYRFDTINAPGAGGHFEIRDGKAVPVAGSRYHFEMREGKWVRVDQKE